MAWIPDVAIVRILSRMDELLGDGVGDGRTMVLRG